MSNNTDIIVTINDVIETNITLDDINDINATLEQ